LALISSSMKESVESVTESTGESSSAQGLVSAPVCAAEPLARLVIAAEPAGATEQLPYSWNNRPQSDSIGAIVCDGNHTAITCRTCGAAMTASSMSNGTRLLTKTTHAVVGYDATSLIFPIGVDATAVDDRGRPGDGDANQSIRSQVNSRLDQCERARFSFTGNKKKLILDDMKLTHNDIPMKDLCGTALGNSLHKLTLAKNRLGSIPAKLVVSLPVLQTLDLSQCELHQLPEHFNLPRLKRLNLRHNRFSYFPDEVSGRVCRRIVVSGSSLRPFCPCSISFPFGIIVCVCPGRIGGPPRLARA
jgi:Leucine rich repeat